MQDLWKYLKSATKPIYLYGTGNGADKILDELNNRGIAVGGVFASDGFVRNRCFRGFKVLSYAEAKKNGDIIVLLSFGTYLPDVIDNIKAIASETEIYAPDVPVIPDNTIFDIEYAKAHKCQLQEVYNCLADEKSKEVFENIVLYKLSGKLEYLFGCETPKAEIFSIFDLANTTTYLDLGAYNGDTINEFLEQCRQYNKIIAVEPDIKNFRKLKNNTESIKNIIYYNAAVGQEVGSTAFSMRGGRNSGIGSGEIISKISVDSLDIRQNSYIKMDVEGAEMEAVLGAANTIKDFKPKMNIAAYHKNADIFDIPLAVLKMNPDYKVYLRHHPYLPAWDTNFYFI